MDIFKDSRLVEMLEDISKTLFKDRQAKKCLIIGSNPSLKELSLADYVDTYEGDVIRINRLPDPGYRDNYGSRTDILFAHKWSLEHYPQDFEPTIAIGEFVEELSGHFKGKDKPILTTGMICILLALRKYEHVELMGFGVPMSNEDGLYKTVNVQQHEIDMGTSNFIHDINYEHKLIWDLSNNDYKGALEILEWKYKSDKTNISPKSKYAFAMYARGDRYIAYQNNLESELKAYIPNADIVIIDAKKAESYLPDIPERSGKWNWDKSIFMRLAIPLMDDFERYDRVVWLDVDTDIVSDKFAGILKVETSKDGLAAVRDSGEAGLMKGFRQSFPGVNKAAYCNSGVLVMDLHKIDRKVWKRRIWKGIEKHLKDGLIFPDQDILNAFFDINLIDDRYNTFSREDLSRCSPWLIHYVAPSGKRKLDDIIKAKKAKVSIRNAINSRKDAIDAVFVVGNGSMDCNEELKYALRSLEKNCKFVRDVYICGICPPWVDRSKVKFLPWPDRFQHAKDANIIDKLRHACEQNGIAKRILFCSDDQFQTRECTWADFMPKLMFKFDPKDDYYDKCNRVWRGRLRKTLLREVQRRKAIGMGNDNVYYYQPHIWMPIDRDRFIDYAKWCGYEKREDTIIASGYFNFVNARGIPNSDHVFLDANASEVPKATHVAYNDGCYRAAIKILRNLFPESSRFEKKSNMRSTSTPSTPSIPSIPRASSVKGADNCYDGYDPSPAAHGEMAEIIEISTNVRNDPSLNSMLGEISRAEELRLFGVRGWRVVWRDIIARLDNNANDNQIGSRSAEAQKIVDAYISNPEAMRTVTFGPQVHRQPTPRRSILERVKASLRIKAQ